MKAWRLPLTKTCPTCCLSLEVAKSYTTLCFNYKFCRPPAAPFLCMRTGAGLRLSNLTPNLLPMRLQPGSSSSALALRVSLLSTPGMHPQAQWGLWHRGTSTGGFAARQPAAWAMVAAVCSASGLLGRIAPGHPSPSGQGSLASVAAGVQTCPLREDLGDPYLPALLGQLLGKLRAAWGKHHGIAQLSSQSCSADLLGRESWGCGGRNSPC